MTIYDIFFDEEHDMTLDGADISFADETNILAQRLTIRLQFLLGEWFLDVVAGLPYTQVIFDQGYSLEDIYSLFRDTIKETEGVDTIESLDFTPDPENKGLRVDFAVNNGVVSTVEVTV